MKFHPSNLIQISLGCLAFLLITSCNKDSDLLAEYVVENPEVALSDNVVTLRNSSVTIKPSEKYSNGKSKKATITDVSSPSIGTAVINEDNSITYTPDADITGTDEFSYTTDVTNTDDTVTQETGSITVTITDKTPISTDPLDMGELKAFPGAEGFGMNTTGGRGGKVIPVTNLNASGPGSLRAALEASGPRVVVFRVGGTIDLGNVRVYIENPNLTIAGETAPGDGILIKNGTLAISTNNVIVRHLRIRGSAPGDDCFVIKSFGSSPVENVIIDHCSMSWAEDENLAVNYGKNITIQNSVISNATYGTLIQKGENISVLENIYALVDQRSIRANYSTHLNLTYEMINNYIYGVNGPGGASQGLKTTTENNISEASNSFSIRSSSLIEFIASNVTGGEPNTVENSYYYVKGNELGDAYRNVISSTTPSKYIFDEPLYRSTYNPLPTSGLKTKLLANAGAYNGLPQGLDAVDMSVVNNIKAKTGRVSSSGTFPAISNGTPYPDADSDGMDDNWEHTNNMDPKDPSDGQKDRNGDGYTNLEEFLHSLTLK